MIEDNDYYGVNNFNSAYAQDANRRALQAEREATLAKVEMQQKLDAANRQIENLKNEKKAPVDSMIKMIDANKELHKKLRDEQDKNIQLESEKEFYKSLLCKPIREIAHHHEGFREIYEALQLLLAEWILSEMAFAETAYEVGFFVGKSKAEITEIYKRNKIAVLLNKTNHGNNAASNDTVIENKDKLIEKVIKNAQLNRSF